MRAITLFSGGGLADIGYEATGYQIVGGCEIDPEIASVHQLNFPRTRLHVGSVATFPKEGWGDVDLLHLSPPCQQYSGTLQPRYKRGDYIDPIVHAMPIIQAIEPLSVVLENVRCYHNVPCFQAFHDHLTTLGYCRIFCKVLNMGDYLIPQTRKRLIAVWTRKPDTTMSLQGGCVGWFDVLADQIQYMERAPFTGWLQKYFPPGIRELVDNQRPGRFMFAPSGYRPTTRKKGLTAITGDKPGFTVMAINNKQLVVYVNGYFYQLRPRQYARLQTVPDYYQLPPGLSLSKKIVGNGVPPVMTYQIGKTLQNSVKSR